MLSTTNTQTRALPPDMLAMSWLSGMATNTAAEVIHSYNLPREVLILGCRPVSAGEQDTRNTAREIYRETHEHTSVGLTVLRPGVVLSGRAGTLRGFTARDAIFELKRLSGLTWEELATLLSVTRRSLHLWANGGAINTLNEKRMRDLLVTIRELDRGTARENRALLLAPLGNEGMTVGDLLQRQQFQDALVLVGRGRGRASPPVTRWFAWKPERLSVTDRLSTSGDRVHTDEGGSLPRRRGPRRGT